MKGRREALNSRSGAIDAQRKTVQRSKDKLRVKSMPMQSCVTTLIALGVAMTASPACWGAVGGSGKDKEEAARAARSSNISGVVRDMQGIVQMGALVQVLTGDSRTVATAFTDQHGQYAIRDLIPGTYWVRASATLFVPVTKANLQLRTGATAVVNLTLAALYDTASWLPAQRRRADESADDWKWTLRSTANRPILRVVEDGTAIEVSSSAAEAPVAIRVKARGAIESGDGGFGQGGVHSIVTLHEGLEDGADAMFRADMGTNAGSGPAGDSRLTGNEIDAGYEARTGFNGGASRTVLSYKSHPELMGAGMTPGGAGVEVFEMTSAQRLSVGERIEVEAGGRLEAVRAGTNGVATHPFVRVSAHPGGEWTLEYRLATDRGLQEFDDVTSGDGEVPIAVVRNGRLALESGGHQEFSVAHRNAQTSVQVAFYRDRFAETAVAGGETGGGAATSSQVSAVPVGFLIDPVTGSFRALARGYGADGARVTISSALTPSLWVAAEYATGDALAPLEGVGVPQPVGMTEALGNLTARHSQTAVLALKGHLLGAGTRVRASYRWQSTREVTAVDSYSSFGDQAYLSCLIRQPIRLARGLPQGLEATIDVTNLLAQGYRPFLSADGKTLYFAQAPRTVQAGLSFSF
jgi:hypothetical protein